ncbi:MAG: helix-turn-helix transcriptional regulator [Myxococcota bacterium]
MREAARLTNEAEEGLDFWQLNVRASGYRARSLAERVGVTPRHLQRLFQARFGMGPQAWIDDYRLALAFKRLEKGQPVKEVAYDLQFRQPSHFSRKFKERYGYPPSELIPNGPRRSKSPALHSLHACEALREGRCGISFVADSQLTGCSADFVVCQGLALGPTFASGPFGGNHD